VNTTIDQLLRSNLATTIEHLLISFPDADSISLKCSRGRLFADYHEKEVNLGVVAISPTLNLASQRKRTFNDAQALTSVHEAGHVVCAALLLDDVPDAAVSVTSASGMGGFVVRTQSETLTQRDRLIRLTAFSLGGYVAEKLIYGEDNLTNGSSSDLEHATARVRHMLGFSGFEIGPAYIQSSNSPFPIGVLDNSGELDRLVLEYMREAETMAASVLSSEHELLLKMSEALFRKGSLRKKEMTLIVNQYAKLKAKDRKKPFPFKSILEEKLNSINGLQKVA
jgi:ATP-dependent Zn protease